MPGPDFDAAKPANSSAMVAAELRTNLTALQRRLYAGTTAVGNVGGGEDDLMSYTLPAGTLAADGQLIRVTASGTKANNANAKTVKVYFGTTVIVSVTLGTSAAGTWRIIAEIARVGATSERSESWAADITTQAPQNGAAPAETLANALAVKLTGTGTANNDIVQTMMVVEFLP